MNGVVRDYGLVSIIVPVYNVEPYIKKCIQSLCDQTYQNIEIIIINDGSLDGSEKIIIDNYSSDDRIKYYKKENGGLSSARNFGIEKCKGDFIAFVDSDDWVDNQFVDCLVSNLVESKSGIAICNMDYIFSNGKIKKRTPKINQTKCVSSEEALKELLIGRQYKCHAQNKMYVAELFKKTGIRFPLGKIYEDVFTTYKLIYEAKNVILINENLYYYLQNRPGSILATGFNNNRFAIFEAIQEAENFFIEQNLNLYKELQKFYILNVVSLVNYLYENYMIASTKEREFYKKELLRVEMNHLRNRYIRNSYISSFEKIRFLMIEKFILLYCFALKLVK